MLANIHVNTKGARNQALLIEGLIALLESKGFEVTNNNDGTVVIAGDVNSLVHQPQPMCAPEAPKSALQVAHSIVHGDREETYGDAGKNLRTIAAYWTTHLKASNSIEAPLTEHDVCGMMILLKQARLASNPSHRDSLVDIAGYVELNDVVQQQKASS